MKSLWTRSNRETPEKELTNKEEQQPIDESKFKFVEVSPIDSIFREQVFTYFSIENEVAFPGQFYRAN